MDILLASAAWLLPALALTLYLLSLHRKIDDRSMQLVAIDLIVFPFCYLLLSMISMLGAYVVGPVVRTPTIVVWLAIVVAWAATHALRWRHKLRAASVSLFIGLSALFCFGAYGFLRVADKPYWAAHEVAKWSACRENLMNIGKAMAIYAGDNNDRLPTANWTDALGKYTDADDYRCPASDAAFGYTMNSEALGVSTFEVAPLLVVAFDGVGGANGTSAGPAGLRWAHSRGTMSTVLTANGNAQWVPTYKLFDYIWDRETAIDPEWESRLKKIDWR